MLNSKAAEPATHLKSRLVRHGDARRSTRANTVVAEVRRSPCGEKLRLATAGGCEYHGVPNGIERCPLLWIRTELTDGLREFTHERR